MLPFNRTSVKRKALPLFLSAMFTAFPSACSKSGAEKKDTKKPPVPVHAAQVEQRAMPVQVVNFGNAEAMQTVEIKSQVTGELIGVAINEGDVVQQGQVLFTIDKRPFEVGLKQAEANVAKAEAQVNQTRAMLEREKAQAANAETELARDAELRKKGMISKEEFERNRTSATGLEAVVKATEAEIQSAAESVSVAKAQRDEAKLQLDYCTIVSPITGKAGSLLLHKGNLVEANSNSQPIVTIRQTKPIYVSFTLSEKLLHEIRDAMARGPVEVQAMVPGDEANPAMGSLSFIDNTVDTLGNIRLKATFPNDDDRLWPGQYVKVVVKLKVLSDALVVPSSAVQAGQGGSFVYVVKPDMTVEDRTVKLGESLDNLTIIADGLSAGEQVVTDGQLRLAPGSEIALVNGNTPTAESIPQ
jgi:multidrug efflux system membrane fusion protein